MTREDCVNRSEAISRIEARRKITCESDPYNYEEWTKGYEEGIDDAIAMIHSIPSVTPHTNLVAKLDEIITKQIDISNNQVECQTLRWVLDVMSELDELPSITPTISEKETVEDCVSKEELRKLICQNNDKYGYSDRFHEFTQKCLQLPSVTPQQTIGHWIDGSICSRCNYKKMPLWQYNYCPICGAKMEVEE